MACGMAIVAALPVSAMAGAADVYLLSAHKLERKNDLKGAEIELRNAAAAEPGNSAIRLQLARVYLKLGNPNAAEAELFAAHWRGAKEDAAAPLMAQTMLEIGQFGDVLKSIPAGNRPPKVESLVRSYRGMAALALSDFNTAQRMFSDARRLNPRSAIPTVGEARLLLQQRQFPAAQQMAEQALRLDSQNEEALDVKALSLAGQGNANAALRLLSGAIAANPHSFRALLDRANLQLQRGKTDGAQADVTRVRKAAPGNAMALLLQAFIDAQRGKYKEADEILGRLRGAMASFPSAYLVAAEVKLNLNQPEQAEAFARRFLAQAGDRAKGYEMLGAIALKRGNLGAGIGSLELASRLAPRDAEIIGLLGQAYVAHGDLDKAKAAFDRAALHAPGDLSLATRRALIDFASGDREAGLAELKKIFQNGRGARLAGPPLVLESLQYGRVDDAAAAAQALVARDPGNATYQELLAAVKISQRDFPAAESLLRALLQKNPSLVSARRDLSQLYMQTHRPALARKLYQDRLSSNPSDIESMLALAKIAFQEEDDRGAAQWLTQAQTRMSSNPRPSLQLIAFLEARKKWPEAIGRARTLHAKFPKDASVQDALAHLYFVSGDQAASLSAYRSAVANFPNSAPIFAHYAVVLEAKKDFSGAAAASLRALRLDPRSVEMKRAYVTLSYRAKGAEGALSASRAVFADGTTAAMVATDILEANNNRPAAIALMEKSLKEKTTGPAIARLAVLYQRDNRPRKGIALMEAWSITHPAEVASRFLLAQLYSVTGRMDDARSQYEWVATQQPDNPVILNNLAWLYSLNHDARARQIAERALRLAPASGSIADTLGWIMVNEGHAAGAIEYLQRASARKPEDAAIQYHLAVALSKTGKGADARAMLQKVIASKANSRTIASARSALAALQASH